MRQLTPAGGAVTPLSRAPDSQRGMALLSVAIYDATVAAWDLGVGVRRPVPPRPAASAGLRPGASRAGPDPQFQPKLGQQLRDLQVVAAFHHALVSAAASEDPGVPPGCQSPARCSRLCNGGSCRV
jgi:hypothetical protein